MKRNNEKWKNKFEKFEVKINGNIFYINPKMIINYIVKV